MYNFTCFNNTTVLVVYCLPYIYNQYKSIFTDYNSNHLTIIFLTKYYYNVSQLRILKRVLIQNNMRGFYTNYLCFVINYENITYLYIS